MKFVRFYFGALVIVGVGCLPSAGAQQASAAVAGGTVTGHVVCGDTQRPARFAHVALFGVPVEITPASSPDAKPDATQIAARMKAVTGGMNMVQGQTDSDGSFAVTNVAPGDYYVFASVPGYEQPVNVVKAAYEAGADPKLPIPGIPLVHVAAGRTSQADVTIQRGAAISGRVVWDDGSPVAAAMVTVISAKGSEKQLPLQFAMLGIAGGLGGVGSTLSISNDLGQFRLSGLAPGDYLVKVTLQTQTQFAMQGGVINLNGMLASSPLEVFAPNAFHQADAKAVTLHAAEDRGDEDVTLNLSGLHSVRGQVTSAEDSHGINSASVRLEDAQDKKFSRSASVDANGNFTVTFVPPGNYNLTVTDAADKEPSKKKPTGLIKMTMDETVRSYEDGKQTVTVTDGDVSGQDVALTPSKTVKKDFDLGDFLKNAPPN